MVLKVESFPDLMDKAFATTLSLAPVRTTRKAAARTALVGLDPSSTALLAECFRQFNIDTMVMTANAAERLHKEKFEACVLSLGDGADLVMEAARSSPRLSTHASNFSLCRRSAALA